MSKNNNDIIAKILYSKESWHMNDHLLKELQHISHSMFTKNYFGVFHGSLSAKTDINAFVINKKEIILDDVDEYDFIRLTSNTKKD